MEVQQSDIANQTQQAHEAVDNSGIPQRPLTDKEMEGLTDVVLLFSQQMTGVTLFPFEAEFGWRLVYSVLVEDAEEITALFSRQSGKTETVAVVVDGMMVLLPLLAQHFPKEERLTKFQEGFWVGIFAPHYKQSAIMWSRMKQKIYSPMSKKVLLDPEIDMDLTGQTENMTFPNGSFADCCTAAPQSKIEGSTYHLVVIDECHDVDSTMIRSSIHPMVTAMAGSIVKVGTCNKVRSEFYEACRRNKRADGSTGRLSSRFRLHYEFDYTVAQASNSRYRKSVLKEMERLGYDSDDFRMKYRLHWLIERGMFVDEGVFGECGIKASDQSLEVTYGTGKRAVKHVFKRPPNVVTYDPITPTLVAAIDVGKERSTVVTIGKVFWEMPIKHGDIERYPIHTYNWLELQGDDHEAQHPLIIDFLANYQIGIIVVDATGKGDPVYSRLKADLPDIEVVRFIFSAQSKDFGYRIFLEELNTKRFTYPAGAQAKRLTKWKNFFHQMTELEKNYRGPLMVVQKPKKQKSSVGDTPADDYCDSAMMLCWVVNGKGTMDVEELKHNPLFGRSERWKEESIMAKAGAWYRRNLSPGRHRRRTKRAILE